MNTFGTGKNPFALVMNALVLETSALKMLVQTSAHTAINVATNKFQTLLLTRYSASKTRESHTLVLTCEYAIPTSYICINVLCWTKWSSS